MARPATRSSRIARIATRRSKTAFERHRRLSKRRGEERKRKRKRERRGEDGKGKGK